MDWTEADIQGLRAQEAKDLAIEFLQMLEAKEKGPISPGEVQMKELELEMRLREAENEDNRRREAHEQTIRELEMQIQQEKTRWAEAESLGDEVRKSFAMVVARVEESSESLSTQLERSRREYNLKLEQLENTFARRQQELNTAIQEMEQRRDALRDEITALTGIQQDAQEVAQLREEIEQRMKETRTEHGQMEEQIASAEFEKTKRIRESKQKQELELAQLDAQHQKEIIQRNQKTADSILASLDMVAVTAEQWQRLQDDLQAAHNKDDNDVARIREQARDEFRREFNITRSDPVDVTELFYQEQAAQSEATRLRDQIEKLDTEIRRMREHIEQEPQRIATAVEAAKTQVQNYIEQGGKR